MLAHAGAADESLAVGMVFAALWVGWIGWSRRKGTGFDRLPAWAGPALLGVAVVVFAASAVIPRAIFGPTALPTPTARCGPDRLLGDPGLRAAAGRRHRHRRPARGGARPPGRPGGRPDHPGHHTRHRPHPPQRGRLARLHDLWHGAGPRPPRVRAGRAQPRGRVRRGGSICPSHHPSSPRCRSTWAQGGRREARAWRSRPSCSSCSRSAHHPAQAHAGYESSDPADGAVLDAAPATVSITFTEPPDPALSSVEVLDAGGTDIVAGPASVQGPRTLVGVTPRRSARRRVHGVLAGGVLRRRSLLGGNLRVRDRGGATREHGDRRSGDRVADTAVHRGQDRLLRRHHAPPRGRRRGARPIRWPAGLPARGRAHGSRARRGRSSAHARCRATHAGCADAGSPHDPTPAVPTCGSWVP